MGRISRGWSSLSASHNCTCSHAARSSSAHRHSSPTSPAVASSHVSGEPSSSWVALRGWRSARAITSARRIATARRIAPSAARTVTPATWWGHTSVAIRARGWTIVARSSTLYGHRRNTTTWDRISKLICRPIVRRSTRGSRGGPVVFIRGSILRRNQGWLVRQGLRPQGFAIFICPLCGVECCKGWQPVCSRSAIYHRSCGLGGECLSASL